MNRIVLIKLSVCLFLWFSAVHCNSNASDKKIAFLYLTRGLMPLEDIWREFFRWGANTSHYSVFVHPHHGYKYPQSSYFHGKEVSNTANVKWGGMSQVRAIKTLVRSALEDPLNEWFCLMSESCIPLLPFNKWRNALLASNKSVTNACAMDPSEMETDTRWRPSLDAVGMKKSHWRKSATWFALKRSHAEVFVNEKVLEPGWESVPCCDEHYLPTILAYNNLDNETTCSDGFVHVNWPSLMASHPRTYSGDEISAELFANLQRPVATWQGFGMRCSGVENVCHFTARKFAGSAKYQLLENIDILLSDDDLPYGGNPWDHHRDKLRIDKNQTLFIVENGWLRMIPDNMTAVYMHLNITHPRPLTDNDLTDYKPGLAMPTRRDGTLYRAVKQRQMFVMKGGKKHAIPNMDTLSALGLQLSQQVLLPETDLDQIIAGEPIADANKAARRRIRTRARARL